MEYDHTSLKTSVHKQGFYIFHFLSGGVGIHSLLSLVFLFILAARDLEMDGFSWW